MASNSEPRITWEARSDRRNREFIVFNANLLSELFSEIPQIFDGDSYASIAIGIADEGKWDSAGINYATYHFEIGDVSKPKCYQSWKGKEYYSCTGCDGTNRYHGNVIVNPVDIVVSASDDTLASILLDAIHEVYDESFDCLTIDAD